MVWMPNWFGEERRTTALGVATVLIALAALVVVIGSRYDDRVWYTTLVVGGIICIGVLAVLVLGFRGPKLEVSEVETLPLDIVPGPGLDVIWRLRVQNRRPGTLASRVQVELAVSTEDGRRLWTGIAHWRHQNDPRYPGLGEMDIAASKKNRRLIDVVYQQPNDTLQIQDDDEGVRVMLPTNRLSITATAFANNITRDVETRWTFDLEHGLYRAP